MKVPNLRVLQHAFEQRPLLEPLVKKAIDYEQVTGQAHEWRMRASSMPGCSVLWFMKRLGYRPHNPIPFSLNFYGKVGTSVHEVFQLAMGQTGKVYGHWKCVNPDCPKHGKTTPKASFDYECPACEWVREYVEVAFKYKSLTGHIDCITQNKGVWAVHDYKTIGLRTMAYKSRENKVSPGYVMQGMIYAWALRKVNKIPVKYFSLMNIARDNFAQRDEYVLKWTPLKQAMMEDFLESQISNYDTAMAVAEPVVAKKKISLKDIKTVVAVKTCDCLQTYRDLVEPVFEYDGGCPYAKDCFSKSTKRLEERLMAEAAELLALE